MKRIIYNKADLKPLLFDWIDSGDTELQVTVVSSYGTEDSFTLIRFPLNDEVDKILATVNDVFEMDYINFCSAGFYIKSMDKLIVSIPSGVNVSIMRMFDQLYDTERCVKLDALWEEFKEKWSAFWGEYFTSLDSSVMQGKHSFIPGSVQFEFSITAQVLVNQYETLRAGDFIREYLNTDFDLPLDEFTKLYVGKADTEIAVTKEEKLRLLIEYMKEGSQFFSNVQHTIQSQHFYLGKLRGKDVIERYCRYLLSSYIAYIAVRKDRKNFKPSKGLECTKEIKKAVMKYYNITFAGSFKVGFRFRPKGHPEEIEATASVKTSALCPEKEELALYGLKILTPKEYKGTVTSMDFPIRAMDILYITYRKDLVYKKPQTESGEVLPFKK